MDKELNEITKDWGFDELVVLQAMYKRLGEILSTKDEDSLRSRVDSQLLEMYQSSGVDRIRQKDSGATLSVRVGKEKETTSLAIRDREAYDKWLQNDGKDYLESLACKYELQLLDMAMKNGEVPGGCEIVKTVTPASIKGTTIRVNLDKVMSALQGELPANIKGFLGA